MWINESKSVLSALSMNTQILMSEVCDYECRKEQWYQCLAEPSWDCSRALCDSGVQGVCAHCYRERGTHLLLLTDRAGYPHKPLALLGSAHLLN